MVQDLVVYTTQFDTHSVLLDEIGEQIADSCLHHYASELLQKGLQDEAELEMALQKAVNTLCTAHLSCRQHIRKVFISNGGDIRNDWRVSDLALRLILLKADDSNPAVARMQVEMVNGEW